MIDEHLACLRVFNEKVEKLRRSQFLKAEGFDLTLSGEQGKEPKVEWRGPDETAIDAFVLTLRLFFQDKDGISVRQLAGIYAKATTDQKQRFEKLREQLNDHLDGSPGFTVNHKPLTWRDILDVVLYGDLAHVDQDKRAELAAWQQMPISEAYVRYLFVNVLYDSFMAINHMAMVNAEITGIPMSTEPEKS